MADFANDLPESVKSQVTPPPVTRAHFQLAYEGPPGVMDVEVLAPALLGIGALCKRANEMFNGHSATVAVNVRSNFQSGSFDINYDVIQTIGTAIGVTAPLITPETIKSARDLAALIGLVTVGDEKAFTSLLGLLKWLRGKRVEKITPAGNNQFTVTNEHGDNITINGDVHQLVVSPAIREAAHQALRPLEQPAITGLEVRENSKVVEDVPSVAVEFFHHENPVPPVTPAAEEVLSDSIGDRAYEVIQPSFDPALMWKMSDGERHFLMKVLDTHFLDDVTAGRHYFCAGSVVVGKYSVRSVRVQGGKIRTDYSLIAATEVRHPPSAHPQGSLTL